MAAELSLDTARRAPAPVGGQAGSSGGLRGLVRAPPRRDPRRTHESSRSAPARVSSPRRPGDCAPISAGSRRTCWSRPGTTWPPTPVACPWSPGAWTRWWGSTFSTTCRDPPSSSGRPPGSSAVVARSASSSPGSLRWASSSTASSTRRTAGSTATPGTRSRDREKDAFDGDAAVPWRLVQSTPAWEWRYLGFEPPWRRRLNTFAYLLSLGFREKSLLRPGMIRPLLALDRWSGILSPFLGLRALLVWPSVLATPKAVTRAVDCPAGARS